jgi:hypothetical protein
LPVDCARREVWVGFWYEYVLVGDGERRRTREKVLGTVKSIGDSRPKAIAKLREVRAELDGKGAEKPQNPTVTELWARYRAIKAERWSKVMENALVSTFKTCVLPAVGQTRSSAVTASQLQGLLNALAAAGRSHFGYQKGAHPPQGDVRIGSRRQNPGLEPSPSDHDAKANSQSRRHLR